MQNNGIGASSGRVGSINTDTNRALIDGQDKTESPYSQGLRTSILICI